ncbi:developmentally-regulated protein [Acrasis kona]|uniref:Developmentally-regulated protein n=1 Tax=Acrasis kona TaxID=1008807 RepID=A0AAW2YNV0_9EUKA
MGNKIKVPQHLENDDNDIKIQSVVNKILQNPTYREKLDKNQDVLYRFATALSIPEDLKATYLSTDWMQTVNLFKKNNADMPEPAPTSTIHKQNLLSHSSNVNEASEVVDVSDEELEFDTEAVYACNLGFFLIIIQQQFRLIMDTTVVKTLRKLVSPILSKLDILPEFGMFHSALMIGPWLIEWNDSSLCVPRKCVSQAALLSADVDALLSVEDIDNVTTRLSKVITHWNVNMKYKSRRSDSRIEGNCQDFVENVLAALGLKYNFDGAVGAFMKKLREDGTCKIQIEADPQFRKKFEFAERKNCFNSHKELDEFVLHLLQVDPEFDKNHKQEWMLLKAFDRALWLRHYKFNNDPKWMPHITEEEGGEPTMTCPFEDPKVTRSILFVK